MKTNNKISAYILRGSTAALLFSCVIVALCTAINLPEQLPKIPPPQDNAAFGVNAYQSQTLSFADRVAYQRAIEDVYWRHRIWPKANAGPKPSLDAVMSQAQIERKVEEYLRNSQVLEDYWQRPITADQLQTEMERMATHTKQPEVLRELFEALGNDPFVIAECLARPIYVEQRSDPLRALVEGGVPTKPGTRRVNPAGSQELAPPSMQVAYTLPVIANPSGGCIDDTWLATTLTNAPTGRYSHTVVWTGSEMIVWGGIGDGNPVDTGGRYNPSTDSWTATSTTNAPEGRTFHTAVWSGSEMIVWGGMDYDPTVFNTGGRYNPSTNSWRATSTAGAPEARIWHEAVWTGSEMIIWGGGSNTGGKYNPGTDSWTATSTTNAPEARERAHTAVWTGSEMIVWGGSADNGGVYFNSGGRYNPVTDNWIPTTTTNAPTARAYHTAVWTGSEMIVWGGSDAITFFNTGGRYDPGTNSWTAISTTGAPEARSIHTAVWIDIDSVMIVWGGISGINIYLSTGGRYDLSANSWTATSMTNAPSARGAHRAVWTDTDREMIVWGGVGAEYFNTGGKYCAAASSPTPTPTLSPTPTATTTPTATATASATPTATASSTPRSQPTPRPRPTPAPRP